MAGRHPSPQAPVCICLVGRSKGPFLPLTQLAGVVRVFPVHRGYMGCGGLLAALGTALFTLSFSQLLKAYMNPRGRLRFQDSRALPETSITLLLPFFNYRAQVGKLPCPDGTEFGAGSGLWKLRPERTAQPWPVALASGMTSWPDPLEDSRTDLTAYLPSLNQAKHRTTGNTKRGCHYIPEKLAT